MAPSKKRQKHLSDFPDASPLANSLVKEPSSLYKSIIVPIQNSGLGHHPLNPYSSKLYQDVVLREIKQLEPHRMVSPFPRRVTALSWHPFHPGLLAAASKGGDLLLWDYTQDISKKKHLMIPGIGPGGSVCAMKFSEQDPNLLFTASISGRVAVQDFDGKNNQVFLETHTQQRWYTSLDQKDKLVLAGDTSGYAYILDKDSGFLVWGKETPPKLHKGKITHLEFHPHTTQVFVSASLDRTVRLWDLRYLKKEPLTSWPHHKPINSAYFNPSGTALLTTDQEQEIRVYRAPYVDHEPSLTILHPHRKFQHLTPIKASWHPLQELIVAGRYPDNKIFPGNNRRSIDIFDGSTGHLLHQIWNIHTPGIISLNYFNRTGDSLASAMGYHVVLWRVPDPKQQLVNSLLLDSRRKSSSAQHSLPRDSDDDDDDFQDLLKKKKKKRKSSSKATAKKATNINFSKKSR